MATAFYRIGKVSTTQNSKVVTGSSARWMSGANKPLAGDVFVIGHHFYEVERIVSDTELHLFTPYTGVSKTNVSYGIMRNASLNISSRLAASVSMAISQKQKMVTELNAWMTDKVGPTVSLTDVFGEERQYIPLPLLTSSIRALVADGAKIAAIVKEGKDAGAQAASANRAVQQAKVSIGETKGKIDAIKNKIDTQERAISTQHGEVNAWGKEAKQSAASALNSKNQTSEDAKRTAEDRANVAAAKRSVDQSKGGVNQSEKNINQTKANIDTINKDLTAKANQVQVNSNQVATDKGEVSALKGETEKLRNQALVARKVAEAIASPFVSGGDFTPTGAKEYPDIPANGTVIIFNVVNVPMTTPYLFTTGDLKNQTGDNLDRMFAFKFAANDIRWSIMKLGDSYDLGAHKAEYDPHPQYARQSIIDEKMMSDAVAFCRSESQQTQQASRHMALSKKVEDLKPADAADIDAKASGLIKYVNLSMLWRALDANLREAKLHATLKHNRAISYAGTKYEQVTTALSHASAEIKAYADSKAAQASSTAKSYTDTKHGAAIHHTNTEKGNVITLLKSFVLQKLGEHQSAIDEKMMSDAVAFCRSESQQTQQAKYHMALSKKVEDLNRKLQQTI